jgi:hypothetical protein
LEAPGIKGCLEWPEELGRKLALVNGKRKRVLLEEQHGVVLSECTLHGVVESHIRAFSKVPEKKTAFSGLPNSGDRKGGQ